MERNGLMILGAAAVAYYLYNNAGLLGTNTSSGAGASGAGAGAAGGATAPASHTQIATVPPNPFAGSPPPGNTGSRDNGGRVAPPTTPAAGSNSLAAIYSRLRSAAGADGFTQGSPDQWDFYLSRVAGSFSPPPPEDVWPGYDRASSPSLTLDQYWAPMSAYLTSNLGMSGLRGPAKYFPFGGWAA